MNLTIETFKIKDLKFGEATCVKDRVLYINREDILAFGREEGCFSSLKLDITDRKSVV